MAGLLIPAGMPHRPSYFEPRFSSCHVLVIEGTKSGEYKLTWVGELKQEILKRHSEG